jgi:hypothetical protein
MASFSRIAVDTQRMTADYGTAKWIEREDAHARHVLSTAKVVVTFSSGIAAAFVAAAMQKDHKGPWSIVAAVLMLVTLFYTLKVLLQRASKVEPEEVAGKPPAEVHDTFRDAALADRGVANTTHRMMVRQVLISLVSCIAAAVELFS